MELYKRSDLVEENLPGRRLQKVVGKDGPCISKKMTMGFARYSAESGPMEPHHHAEETLYIVDAKDGWIRTGAAADRLGEKIPLNAGMTLHFPELEWHVFGWEENGSVDAIYFYGQVDNIRPEEIRPSTQGK